MTGFVVVGQLAPVSVRADAQVSVRGFSARAELAAVITVEVGKTTSDRDQSPTPQVPA